MKSKSKDKPMLWMIWCHERHQWWRPDRIGYTPNRQEAGRYSLEDALEVACRSNVSCGHTPEESLVPDTWSSTL